MQNRHRSRGKRHTRGHIQTSVLTVKLQPRRRTAWTNFLKYNDYCFQGQHHTTLWHLWAHLQSHHDLSKTYAFHVVNTAGPTILGLPTCRDMKFVTLNYGIATTQTEEAPMPKTQGSPDAKSELLCQYQDCFQGIGCFQREFHITLDPTVPPVIHPPRQVPKALREPLKRVRDALVVEQGIIAKVDEPTDWVNHATNATLRLCLDTQELNHAIKRPRHCTLTLDDVLPKLNGAKYFSIVDARRGYWNIKLDHASSFYTTFNSPQGRYRFLRLPFGLICAQYIFQKKVDETFGDLPGVTGIADDIVIYGCDPADQDTNLKAVMERARGTSPFQCRQMQDKMYRNIILWPHHQLKRPQTRPTEGGSN